MDPKWCFETKLIGVVMRNLTASQKEAIATHLRIGHLSDSDIARQSVCSTRAVERVRYNLNYYGTVSAPRGKRGPAPLLNGVVVKALLQYLKERLD